MWWIIFPQDKQLFHNFSGTSLLFTNEDNFGSSDYIAKVNYIKKYVENFRGLTNITETSGLSSAQLRLKDSLANQLNRLADGYTEVNVDTGTTVQMPGILETALENYVKFFVATKSILLPVLAILLKACKLSSNLLAVWFKSKICVPFFSIKMYWLIFGCLFLVKWPKWTPASSNWRNENSGRAILKSFPV